MCINSVDGLSSLTALDLAQPDRLSWHLQLCRDIFFHCRTLLSSFCTTRQQVLLMRWIGPNMAPMLWNDALLQAMVFQAFWVCGHHWRCFLGVQRVEFSVHCPTVIWILSDKLQIPQRESIQMEWQSFSLKPALQNEFLTEADHYITTIIIKAWSHHLGSTVGPILTMPVWHHFNPSITQQ